jgi:hypothetical protein
MNQRNLLLTFVWLFFATVAVCHAQSPSVVCTHGTGSFEEEFRTGVRVRVGAARNGELATRACEAELSWDKQERVIGAGAPQLDVDALGVDLGLGAPVVTFQVKTSNVTCCMEYQIYSLQKPPRLLRTITGGEFFSAADTDLDGRVEIWTRDAASVDGFEGLVLDELDFAPTVVLRFEGGRMRDVSAEFQPYFDEEIARVRAELASQDLQDFKNSDGRSTAPVSAEGLRRKDHLQAVKAKVLEIVWSYLYSGREQEAWRSLADMWPTADTDRIHAAILRARAGGIRVQVDDVSTGVPAGQKQHAQVVDARTTWTAGPREATRLGIVLPKTILIERRPPSDPSKQSLSELQLDLVIDSAGKVRSAEPANNASWLDADLISATARWKFIPAFANDRAVASRVYLAVSPKR